MRFLQVFSHFSHMKSARLGPHSGSELSVDFTLWTPAACGAPVVPEPVPEAEFEEEDLDKWVDEFGRWCSTPLMAWSGGMSPGRADELLVWLSVLGEFLPVVVQRQVLGWFSAEHESLFMRQSAVASGRISAFLARAVHTWNLHPHGSSSFSMSSCRSFHSSSGSKVSLPSASSPVGTPRSRFGPAGLQFLAPVGPLRAEHHEDCQPLAAIFLAHALWHQKCEKHKSLTMCSAT